MNPEKVGLFIRELREKENMSQDQLADILYVDRSLISKWENGRLSPDIKYLQKLCKIFKIELTELISGELIDKNNESELKNNLFDYLASENSKYKKVKFTAIASLTITILAIFAFLIYYFFQTYNTTRTYRLYGVNNEYTIDNGLLVITREYSYLLFSDLEENVSDITVYYLSNNEKTVIYEGPKENIILDYSGYNSSINLKNIDKIKNNLYIDLKVNDSIVNIKLDIKDDLKNDSLIFDDKTSYIINNDNNTFNNEIPTYIKDNFKCDDLLCSLSDSNYNLRYDINTNILNISKDDINIDYLIKDRSLYYTSNKYNFNVINGEMECNKKDCTKENKIYNELYENYIKKVA